MTRQIRIPNGYRVTKTGKLVKSSAHKDASARIRESKSKRVKYVRGGHGKA